MAANVPNLRRSARLGAARLSAAQALAAPTGASTGNRNFSKFIEVRDQIINPPPRRNVANYPAAVADAARIAALPKNDQKTARVGQFAWQETHFTGEGLTQAEVENAYRLAHWNASHEAAASGLIAEGPAVEAGIRNFFGVDGRNQAAEGNKPQTTIYSKGGLRVDVVDCFTMPNRNAGINPFSFIFNEVIPIDVMPWELTRVSNNNWKYRDVQLTRRTADATYFQKGRVDMNLLKIWCGATDTVDTRQWKAATVPATMQLTNAQGQPIGRNGSLDATKIRKLQTGIITGLGINGDRAKNEKLRQFLANIFRKEKTIFVKDCKGPLDVETDLRIHKKLRPENNNRNANQANARWAANKRRAADAVTSDGTVKEEVEIGESKVSDGPSEPYPGEAFNY